MGMSSKPGPVRTASLRHAVLHRRSKTHTHTHTRPLEFGLPHSGEIVPLLLSCKYLSEAPKASESGAPFNLGNFSDDHLGGLDAIGDHGYLATGNDGQDGPVANLCWILCQKGGGLKQGGAVSCW